jgi:hypothetical protein
MRIGPDGEGSGMQIQYKNFPNNSTVLKFLVCILLSLLLDERISTLIIGYKNWDKCFKLAL